MSDNTQTIAPEDFEEAHGDSKFDRARRLVGAVFGPISALLVWFTPIAGLSPEAHKLLAIVTLVALWSFGALSREMGGGLKRHIHIPTVLNRRRNLACGGCFFVRGCIGKE